MGKVKVFTKYDSIPEEIEVPCIKYIPIEEYEGKVTHQSDYMSSEIAKLENIEPGLEGVQFVHYIDK